MTNQNKKVLVLDGNFLMMQAVFVWHASHNQHIPVNYYTLMQLFKWVKLYKPDQTYVVGDGGESWRKGIYADYKANRKKARAKYTDIPWAHVFESYSDLLKDLQEFTPINTIRMDHIEGDDLISYLCRYLTNSDLFVVTKDKDISQLTILPNVTMVTPVKGGKVKELAYPEGDILEEKVRKGDVSDNIPKANDFLETVRNHILIDLINLPPIIDVQIQTYINKLTKHVDIEQFKQLYPYKFMNSSLPLL